jgi:hypothetical protein
LANSKKLWSEIKSDFASLANQRIAINEGTSKDSLREIHKPAAIESQTRDLKTIHSNPVSLKKYFLAGSLLNPKKIDPQLIPTTKADEYEDLFKAATTFWSVPISRGYGRRIRFVILDRYHNALIGILGLMDPVFNLSARDKWIGWDLNQKYKRLRSVMDCYVLGAVPPYNAILGGKLIASLAFSKELRNHFYRKYHGTRSEIARVKHDGKLALLTVTSALGRSSIYNRLTLPWGQRYQSIGYTLGYGVFHVSNELFVKIKEALELEDHPYANAYKFGQGPNWKMRVLRYAMERTGFGYLLNHGVRREVFAMELGRNTKRFLNGESRRHLGHTKSVNDIASYWKERWGLPRAQKDDSYLRLNSSEMFLGNISHILSSPDEVSSPTQSLQQRERAFLK